MNKVTEILSYREPNMLWLTVLLLTGKKLHFKYDTAASTKVRIRHVLNNAQDFEKYDHWELSQNGHDKITFDTNEMPALVKLDIDFVQSLSVQNQCESSPCSTCNGIGGGCGECCGVGWE